MFLILCNELKTRVFVKAYRYFEGFSNRHVAAFFERSFLKDVCILRYPHNNWHLFTNRQSMRHFLKIIH